MFEINDGKNLVYYVDHVPTLVHETASKYISKQVAPYIEMLLKGGEMNETLYNAIIMNKGEIIPERLGF